MRARVRPIQSHLTHFRYILKRQVADQVDSDYKDDGTNILLDANENAYGPSLALDGGGRLHSSKADDSNSTDGSLLGTPDIDFLGLNRYPDPYVWVFVFLRHHPAC